MKSFVLNEVLYEPPTAREFEMDSDGILCTSPMGGTLDNYLEDTYNWNK